MSKGESYGSDDGGCWTAVGENGVSHSGEGNVVGDVCEGCCVCDGGDGSDNGGNGER